MKKVNGGAPQTPKNAPSRPQPGVPGPELNRLMSADMHPADAALALRENQAHLILSRAAVDGVDLQPASSTRSGRVRSPSVGEVHGALDVMSRAAKKSGARQGVLANASMMKLSRGLQATEASAATLCLSNMLSILSANLGDYGNFAIGEQMAKEAASRMVALEVFATAQTATTRVPKAADPNLRLDVDAAASVVAQRIGHLTAADAKRQADDMVQALCAGLHSLGPRTPEGPLHAALADCAPHLVQLLDDKRFDGNAKHQLAGEPLLRLAVALLSPVSSQANWRTWLAQTPEDAVGMNQESARGALLRVVVRGPMAADTIDVKIAGWRVNKYVLPGDGRVFLASRVGADVQRNLSPETETVVLYFNPSHERIPLGKITEAYMKMIRGQYDKATDTFLKGRG